MESKVERLIGDFLEINANIVQDEFESKIPKFIKKFKYKKLRQRLLDNVDKLRQSEIILNTDNLIEYFSYIVSNFYPETKYGVITKCRVDEASGLYEAVLSFENQSAIISIDKSRYPKFNVSSRIILEDETASGINIETEQLQSDTYKKDKILGRINNMLLNDICNFITDRIKPYQEDIKENDNNGDSEKFIQIRID